MNVWTKHHVSLWHMILRTLMKIVKCYSFTWLYTMASDRVFKGQLQLQKRPANA